MLPQVFATWVVVILGIIQYDPCCRAQNLPSESADRRRPSIVTKGEDFCWARSGSELPPTRCEICVEPKDNRCPAFGNTNCYGTRRECNNQPQCWVRPLCVFDINGKRTTCRLCPSPTEGRCPQLEFATSCFSSREECDQAVDVDHSDDDSEDDDANNNDDDIDNGEDDSTADDDIIIDNGSDWEDTNVGNNTTENDDANYIPPLLEVNTPEVIKGDSTSTTTTNSRFKTDYSPEQLIETTHGEKTEIRFDESTTKIIQTPTLPQTITSPAFVAPTESTEPEEDQKSKTTTVTTAPAVPVITLPISLDETTSKSATSLYEATTTTEFNLGEILSTTVVAQLTETKKRRPTRTRSRRTTTVTTTTTPGLIFEPDDPSTSPVLLESTVRPEIPIEQDGTTGSTAPVLGESTMEINLKSTTLAEVLQVDDNTLAAMTLPSKVDDQNRTTVIIEETEELSLSEQMEKLAQECAEKMQLLLDRAEQARNNKGV